MEDEDTIAMGEDRVLDEASADQEDMFELEMDGATHVLPAALKGAFLRQADYTRKTQELAEHRRQIEAERDAFSQEVASHRGATADRIRLAALDQQLDEFEQVDWESYAAQAPDEAQDLWQAYQRLAGAREQLFATVSHHAERAELKAAREAADAMAETGRTLSREIEGWSPETAQKLVEYAEAFGVSLEELRETADPRLWKLLHRAWRADQAASAEAQAQASSLRPAVVISGAGGSSGVRDELGLKEWMRRRNAQTTGGR